MLAASLVTIPLYMLLRRTVSRSTAWICAALWPSIPGHGDLHPEIGCRVPADRRGIFMGLADCLGCPRASWRSWQALIAWCGLLQPGVRARFYGRSNDDRRFDHVRDKSAGGTSALSHEKAWGDRTELGNRRNECSPGLREDAPDATTLASSCDKALASSGGLSLENQPVIGIRRWACIPAAGLGFAIPTLLLFLFARINLLNVWCLNYQNHAGFYRHYSRTYWKWLLANPLELSFAVGWPVALLAIIACWRIIRGFRVQAGPKAKADLWKVVGPVVMVWGLLWITGKNSGEAARIWILFIPWLIWIAGIQLEAMLTTDSSFRVRQRQVVALLAIQFVVCLLTVARVSGFHPESG